MNIVSWPRADLPPEPHVSYGFGGDAVLHSSLRPGVRRSEHLEKQWDNLRCVLGSPPLAPPRSHSAQPPPTHSVCRIRRARVGVGPRQEPEKLVGDLPPRRRTQQPPVHAPHAPLLGDGGREWQEQGKTGVHLRTVKDADNIAPVRVEFETITVPPEPGLAKLPPGELHKFTTTNVNPTAPESPSVLAGASPRGKVFVQAPQQHCAVQEQVPTNLQHVQHEGKAPTQLPEPSIEFDPNKRLLSDCEFQTEVSQTVRPVNSTGTAAAGTALGPSADAVSGQPQPQPRSQEAAPRAGQPRAPPIMDTIMSLESLESLPSVPSMPSLGVGGNAASMPPTASGRVQMSLDYQPGGHSAHGRSTAVRVFFGTRQLPAAPRDGASSGAVSSVYSRHSIGSSYSDFGNGGSQRRRVKGVVRGRVHLSIDGGSGSSIGPSVSAASLQMAAGGIRRAEAGHLVREFFAHVDYRRNQVRQWRTEIGGTLGRDRTQLQALLAFYVQLLDRLRSGAQREGYLITVLGAACERLQTLAETAKTVDAGLAAAALEDVGVAAAFARSVMEANTDLRDLTDAVFVERIPARVAELEHQIETARQLGDSKLEALSEPQLDAAAVGLPGTLSRATHNLRARSALQIALHCAAVNCESQNNVLRSTGHGHVVTNFQRGAIERRRRSVKSAERDK